MERRNKTRGGRTGSHQALDLSFGLALSLPLILTPTGIVTMAPALIVLLALRFR